MSERVVELPGWVVCPVCLGEIARRASDHAISCRACARVFPVRAGIVELLDDDGLAAADSVARDTGTSGYHAARHLSPCGEQYYDYWCGDILGRLPQGRFERVIEIMAGGAELSRRASGLPHPIVAIDLNRVLLQLNRDALIPDVVPVCATAERLPFRDGSVDVVLIQGGLHHVRRRVDVALSEIARCMAPGAVLLASEPRNDNLLLHGFRRLFYHLHPIPDAQEEDGFTRAQLDEHLRKAGLVLDQYEPFAYLGYMLLANTDLLPVLGRMRRNRLSTLLVDVDRLLRRVPVLRGLGWASQIRAYKPGAAASPQAARP